MARQYLQIPGPTNIPDRVLRAMNQPMVNHRGPEFTSLLADCTSGMREVFGTKGDVLLFPSSGTGGLESAVVNTLSPGDKVLCVLQGVFSLRFMELAKKFGAIVDTIEVDWGRAVDPRLILDKLSADKDYKAVLVSHNETSTGVLNNVAAIGKGIHKLGHQALLFVDSISALGMTPMQFDAWHIDVNITGSQKGLMLPPGMSMVAISERAWQAYESAKMPRYYWDWMQLKKANANGATPYTPATGLMFGLRESLAMIKEEGLDNIYARHARISKGVREAVRAIGLSVLPPEDEASPTVTAVNLPAGNDGKEISNLLRAKYRLIIGEGLQKLAGKIIRIGHMGEFYEPEALAVMACVEMGFVELGMDIKPGTAVTALEKVLLGK
jgi:alanine-glyoxylate transaminase / serine-glyoxylate transaminase / serine-pyruvate transaminase